MLTRLEKESWFSPNADTKAVYSCADIKLIDNYGSWIEEKMRIFLFVQVIKFSFF